MNQAEPAPGAGPGVTTAAAGGFVEWAPIIAGAVLASALSFVLLTFGTAIGLSATSPWPNSGLSAKVVASIAIFWTMVQQIGAFMAGAYVAGRMRAKWRETSRDEVEFRDGLHGGLVWAVGVGIGAALLMMAAGGTARTASEVAGTAVSSTAASTSEPLEAVLDTMLRPSGAAKAPPAGVAAPNESRKEISRILTTSVTTGTLSNENRTYLAQLVAQRTGISQQEAEKRVIDAQNAARETIDKARRASVLTGLVTAVGLIVSFGAAWWAAQKGGQHRDSSVPARFEFGARRTTSRPMT